MEATESWRSVFENWPEAIPREGIIVMRGGESIPFIDFLMSGGIILIERNAPDSTGARKVMIGYQEIAAVKIPTPMELDRFQVMGFQPPM